MQHIGEVLYDKLQEAGSYGRHGMFGLPWATLPPDQRVIFGNGALLFLAEYGIFPDPASVNAVPATPERNWKAELKKFGRHSPNCPPYGLCTCGYAEVEKELAA